MTCALIFRLSRTPYCVQHILNRVNAVLPPQLSAARAHGPGLIGLTTSAPAGWTQAHHRRAAQSRDFRAAAHLGRRADDRGAQDAGRLSVSRSKPTSGASVAHTVKQAGTDFTYLVVVLVGLGVTGGLLYVIFQELFSSSSPSNLYGKAFDKCSSHPEVIGVFGEPIKGYGETTRRGRRQQVSHVEYLKNGQKHMRIKFYIEGSEPGLHGTVHSETKENPETGKYEFRYIFVDIDTYPRRTIVVEDNR